VSKIFDAAIELQLDILRASEGVSASVLKILKRLERELIAAISADELTEWGKARAQRQLNESRKLIQQYYDRIAVQSLGDTDDIAKVAAAVTSTSMGAAAVLPTAAVLDRVATNAVIQGAAQGAWWAKQSADTAFKFAGAVRQGIAAAETNAQIIVRVREVMQVSRANAAALVQTATATIANDARQAVFEANEDIVLRYRAVATLDTHTCTTCAPLDGLEWTKAGEPIGHKFPMPTYPLHFNCRCLKIPVVLDGPPGGQRASADGPIPAATTFSDWLERQPADRQDAILGKGRADLYRKGTITLSDLVTGRGRPLTIEQLKTKYN
jgi:SPP1 gp7 family putative phage head morphogenesis protein